MRHLAHVRRPRQFLSNRRCVLRIPSCVLRVPTTRRDRPGAEVVRLFSFKLAPPRPAQRSVAEEAQARGSLEFSQRHGELSERRVRGDRRVRQDERRGRDSLRSPR